MHRVGVTAKRKGRMAESLKAPRLRIRAALEQDERAAAVIADHILSAPFPF